MPLIDFRYAPWQAYYWPATLLALARKPKGRKFRHLLLANPALPNGGALLISKIEAGALLKAHGAPMPPFAVVEGGRVLADPDGAGARPGPFYVKPELGLRKIGIAYIETFAEAVASTKTRKGRFLVQPKVTGREYTIMFQRGPDEKLFIRAMVEHVRLEVVGDGRSSLGTLILATGRGRSNYMRKKLGSDWDEIPAQGARRTVSRFGTSGWGARYDNVEPRPPWAHELARKLSAAAGLNAFKLDVLVDQEGRNHPIDLNGANAEATDAYVEPIKTSAFIPRFASALTEAIEAGYRSEQKGAVLPSRIETFRRARAAHAAIREIDVIKR